MILKRAVSGLVTATMLLTSAALMPVAQAEGAPVIKVDFDTETNYSLQGNAKLVTSWSGNALSLDGTDSTYAKLNDTVAEELAKLSGDFSISVWVKANTVNVWNRVIDFGNSTDSYIFLCPSAWGSGIRLAVKPAGAGEQQLDTADALEAGEWHNIAITRKDGTSTMYIDGAAKGTSTAVTSNFSDFGKLANCYIGKSQFPDPYLSGMVDNLEIYDYALDAAKIAADVEAAKTEINKGSILENNCYVTDTEFFDAADKKVFAYNAAETAVEGEKKIKTAEDGIIYKVKFAEDGRLTSVRTQEIKANTETATDAAEDEKLMVWNANYEPIAYEEVKAEEGKLKAVTSVENDTANTGTVYTELYAVAQDGTETKIGESKAQDIASTKSAKLAIEAADSAVPEGTVKLIVKVVTGADEAYTAATLYAGIQAPVEAPADSGDTTFGAHDPSIVKFKGDDTYYAYSSHHLIFTSTDLVNWKKYDFTNINAKDITPKTYDFISKNYANTTMNGTYWAPDVIYKEGDDHPYWMYISLSCGLGGRNSAISLMKSNSPLFWADKNADIIDAGVVFATKETSGYKTNAIDANIYTDTDGTQYFVWGSFWGGIQATKLTEDGFAEGVNYTSDATILSSCGNNFGTSVFTQKNGVAGPEGAWMLNIGDYRYMFTSYGWLGSNYNTRIARAPLSQAFSENMGTQLTDANGVVMGTQYSSGSTSKLSGYKLIGSYRLGEGAMTLSKDSINNYYYARTNNDAHVYYGTGHNSAITADNGKHFYVSHVRKDAVEGAALLQVRKMLFTEDGWPIVSAVSYAGEVEQPLPKDMLLGTYELASVGRTKMEGSSINTGTNPNRNYDLPVISSKVTLNEDGTMADGLGTWEFDGDHKLTLKFAKDGDTSKDEFYKSGDVMTMYALFGYDKDEKTPVIALTGTDQNHITQIAKKNLSNSFKTPAKLIEDTTPVVLEKSTGGNPELGFDADGNILYAGDPAATVVGDTVYMIAGHDTATNESYVMPEWVVYSSKNMTDWEYKGVAMKATDISWRSNDTSAWASQMAEYNGKYYLYFCTWDKTSSGKQSIGVAVADKPEGPYTDALGKPLVSGNFTTPESAGHDDIDPTVLIDTDENGVEHRYLAWGNTRYYVCELNEDMTSIKDIDGDGAIVMHKDVVERKMKSMNGSYTEAPWLYKRDGKYYLFFAMNWREQMAYAMCDTPMGRYDYKQTLMPASATANTNHPSVIDFNGKTYFIYHNGALPHGSGFRRSVCIQELEFDENGYIYPLTETSIGLDGTASVIKTADGYLGHSPFVNSGADSAYPLSSVIDVKSAEDGYNTAWEIEEAKYVPEGADKAEYVSIQSVNKPGLYIKATENGAVMTQDADGKQGAAMSFKTVKGLNDANGVSFECADRKGYFLTVSEGQLTISSTGANATFYIDKATQKDVTVIDVAPVEADPQPGDDVSENFDSAMAGTIMTLAATDPGANTDYRGISLYIGARSGGGTPTTGWFIEAANGVDGSKALVMRNGRWANGNRGPRMQLAMDVIPDGKTMTAQFDAKLGSGGELYYGDSTGTQGANALTDKLSESAWSKVKITISNSADTYTRTIYVNDVQIAQDYVGASPVFWGRGTDNGDNPVNVYIDNIDIKTTDSATAE